MLQPVGGPLFLSRPVFGPHAKVIYFSQGRALCSVKLFKKSAPIILHNMNENIRGVAVCAVANNDCLESIKYFDPKTSSKAEVILTSTLKLMDILLVDKQNIHLGTLQFNSARILTVDSTCDGSICLATKVDDHSTEIYNFTLTELLGYLKTTGSEPPRKKSKCAEEDTSKLKSVEFPDNLGKKFRWKHGLVGITSWNGSCGAALAVKPSSTKKFTLPKNEIVLFDFTQKPTVKAESFRIPKSDILYTAVAIDPAGNQVCVCGKDGKMYWLQRNPTDFQWSFVSSQHYHDHAVAAMVFCQHGDSVYSADERGKLVAWETSAEINGKSRTHLKSFGEPVIAGITVICPLLPTFYPHSAEKLQNIVAVITGSNSLRVLDCSTGNEINTVNGIPSPIVSPCTHAIQRVLAPITGEIQNLFPNNTRWDLNQSSEGILINVSFYGAGFKDQNSADVGRIYMLTPDKPISPFFQFREILDWSRQTKHGWKSAFRCHAVCVSRDSNIIAVSESADFTAKVASHRLSFFQRAEIPATSYSLICRRHVQRRISALSEVPNNRNYVFVSGDEAGELTFWMRRGDKDVQTFCNVGESRTMVNERIRRIEIEHEELRVVFRSSAVVYRGCAWKKIESRGVYGLDGIASFVVTGVLKSAKSVKSPMLGASLVGGSLILAVSESALELREKFPSDVVFRLNAESGFKILGVVANKYLVESGSEKTKITKIHIKDGKINKRSEVFVCGNFRDCVNISSVGSSIFIFDSLGNYMVYNF